MSSDTQFISDIHLNPHDTNLTQRFVSYLDELTDSSNIKNLFILGDLFEYWIGDDDRFDEFNHYIIQRILNLKNINKYLIKGNRDFLLNHDFAHDAHLEILPDPFIITLDNKTTLLSHGDIFCTDDVEYQKFRQMVRSEQWQHQFLSQSLEQRKAIAEQLRQQSHQAKYQKSSYEMDVNLDTLNRFMQDYHAEHVIHGHTHKPAFHQHDFYTREVLSAW